MRGFSVFFFFLLEITFPLIHLFRFGFSLSIKLFLLPNLSFYSIFFVFFLSSTYCDVWICRRMMIVSFIGFCVSDSNDIIVSIKQINHIKFVFINIFHHKS